MRARVAHAHMMDQEKTKNHYKLEFSRIFNGFLTIYIFSLDVMLYWRQSMRDLRFIPSLETQFFIDH